MFLITVLCCSFLAFTNGLIYIDRAIVESNPAVMNVTVDYSHNAKGNSETNANASLFVTITKALIYFKVKFPQDGNDVEYKREFISTVFDVTKSTGGVQSNIMTKNFFGDLYRAMDFEMKFPMAPVSGHDSKCFH